MGNDQSTLSRDILNTRAGDSANSIRKKVIHGYQFRMKVVVRGDKNTGKTQLWNRLLGKGFNAGYQQTSETKIGSITWDYQSTNDVINVEIWDLVDSTRKKKRRDGFKLSNADDEDDGLYGAESADPENRVYTTEEAMRGAAGVIFMFDPSKKWTWEYVQREVPGALATGAFVLIVANYRDCWAEGCVTELEAKLFVTEQQNPNLYFTEASMKNAYGIRSIATFFTIPFMVIQRAWIESELKRNEEELKTSKDELELLIDDYTYETHMKQLADKRNAIKRAEEEKKHEKEVEEEETKKKEDEEEEEESAEKKKIVTKAAVKTVPKKVEIKKDEEIEEEEEEKVEENEENDENDEEAAELKLKKEKEAAELKLKKEKEAAELKLKKEKEAAELKLKKEKEAKERAKKEKEAAARKAAEEKARKAEEEKARKRMEKEAAELEKKKKKGPTKEELKKQKMDQESTIAQLKELSAKGGSSTMTMEDVDDFKPDDGGLDDAFFGKVGAKNDGWITTEPEEDVWGTGTLGEEEEEEEEEPQPPKKAGKKKKKQTIILDDEDEL